MDLNLRQCMIYKQHNFALKFSGVGFIILLVMNILIIVLSIRNESLPSIEFLPLFVLLLISGFLASIYASDKLIFVGSMLYRSNIYTHQSVDLSKLISVNKVHPPDFNSESPMYRFEDENGNVLRFKPGDYEESGKTPLLEILHKWIHRTKVDKNTMDFY